MKNDEAINTFSIRESYQAFRTYIGDYSHNNPEEKSDSMGRLAEGLLNDLGKLKVAIDERGSGEYAQGVNKRTKCQTTRGDSETDREYCQRA